MISRENITEHGKQFDTNELFIKDFNDILDEAISKFRNIKDQIIQSEKFKYPFECDIEKSFEMKYRDGRRVPLSPRACIKATNRYEIKISIQFMRELCVYADLISIQYFDFWKEKFGLKSSAQEIRNALFGSWCLIILCHEAAHVFNGHLDLLVDKGLIHSNINLTDAEYIELITDNNSIHNMKIQENQDLWKSIEAEADTYAAQSAMPCLFSMNNIKSVLSKIEGIQEKTELAYECIGHILIPFFHFMDLISSKEDTRHPKPFERAYISATAFNQFIYNKGGTQQDFENILSIILRAYHDIFEKLEIQVNELEEKKNAITLMSNIANILDANGMQQFRKKNKQMD